MRLSAAEVKQLAYDCGFQRVGITTADPLPADEERTIARVAGGAFAGLPWFTEQRARESCRPRERFPLARSIICLASSCFVPAEPRRRDNEVRGKVSRYAWGTDYHGVVGERLRSLAGILTRKMPGAVIRPYVDTGAVAERALAVRAGVGWWGKSTNVLTPAYGSWVFLSELITDIDIEPDEPLAKNCGSCTRCIAACPTGALTAAYQLDANRCISFLTIELRGSIPLDLRPAMGDRVFGCDVCQEVCRVNSRSIVASDAQFMARHDGCEQQSASIDLLEVLRMDAVAFRRAFRDSAVWRAKLEGLQRNASVVVGNLRWPEAVPLLLRHLADGAPVVRAHAAWALGQIGHASGLAALRRRLPTEGDASVHDEIVRALLAN